MSEVLVVGAGVSGLSAAVLLARRGHRVELWESEAEPGGMLRPVRFRGVPCDRGAHRVHADALPELARLMPPGLFVERPREGRIILGGRRLRYPIRPLGFLAGIGPRAAVRLGAGFLAERGRLRRFLRWEEDRTGPLEEDEGFERFVVSRVGIEAYRRFYRPYAEKIWGVDPTSLSRSVAKQRVSTRWPARGRRSFLYPRRGMGAVIAALAEAARGLGVELRYGRAATPEALSAAGHRFILHSGHLSELAPAQALEHRGLFLVYLALPRRAVASPDTHYLPGDEYWFGRVSRIDAFSPELGAAGESVLCLEVPDGRFGPDWDPSTHLAELSAQLRRAKIVNGDAAPRAASIVHLPRVYPLYGRGWATRWRDALRSVAAADPRIRMIGRQGLYLHCNIDHCLAISGAVAENVDGGGEAEAWRRRAERFLELRVRD